MTGWIQLDPDLNSDDLGLLWDILIDTDPRPVKDQLADRYYVPGIKFDSNTMIMRIPGDAPYYPSAMTQIGKETVVFYRKGPYLAIVQMDGAVEVMHID